MTYRFADNVREWAFGLALCPFDLTFSAMRRELKRIWPHGFGVELVGVPRYGFGFAKSFNPDPLIVQLTAMSGEVSCTLIETNVADGYPALSRNLARLNPEIRIVHVHSAPEGTCQWPVEWFTVFANGEVIRDVHVRLDHGGWVFEENGRPLEFEDIDWYRDKPLKLRLTREIIRTYLRKMNIEVDELSQVKSGQSAVFTKHRLVS